jgi:tetratricopeptide (TPR) repeat protein
LLGLGRPKDAIKAFENARKIFQRLGPRQNVAACDGNIGNALRELSQWSEAIDRYEQAQAVFRNLETSSWLPPACLASFHASMEARIFPPRFLT